MEFLSLPDELITHILTYLKPRELLPVFTLNKQVNRLFDESFFTLLSQKQGLKLTKGEFIYRMKSNRRCEYIRKMGPQQGSQCEKYCVPMERRCLRHLRC